MKTGRSSALVSIGLWLALASPAACAQQPHEPSFRHGLGRAIWGLIFELPKTTLDATLTEPPVLGTLVGLLAGTMNALRITGEGLQEMAVGFNPWGMSKRHRISR